MGKEKIQKRYNSLWSVFGNLYSSLIFFRRKNNFLGSPLFILNPEASCKKKYKKLGFTLIELIVVFAVISILAGIAMTVLNPFEQFRKANDARRKSDLAQIARGLEAYYQDNGRYPKTDGAYHIVALVNGVDTALLWGGGWSPYMDTLPKDPDSTKKYAYITTNDGQSYWLYTSLERGAKDPQACAGGVGCPYLINNGISFSICGINYSCNYGITSPNVSP